MLRAKKRENKNDEMCAFRSLQLTGQSRHTNMKELSNNVRQCYIL